MTLTKQRFLPLDVLRGMTICFMIIVNTPGGPSYWPLDHAAWNGFTPTDLVFPTFLFVVGNAMSFTMRRYEEQGNGAVLSKIFKRTLLIFLCGFLLYWFPFVQHTDAGWAFKPLSHTRILGVLQRIALCYCIASLMIHFLPKGAVLTLSVIFLLGYWFLAWYFGDPGGVSPDSVTGPFTLHGNADLKLDRLIMGDNHLYRGEGFPFDPEGILSTIPAIVNVVAGYYAGLFVQKHSTEAKSLWKMAGVGALLIILAWVWNPVFPVNKKIWTSSFVLNTVGIDLILLSFLIFIIDFQKLKGWTGFFTTVGKNPLAIYLLSELLIVVLDLIKVGPDTSLTEWIITHTTGHISPEKLGSLCFAIAYMLVCWSVGKWMEVKKIYIRL
ncbi:acyltransferase family protein [Dinghuibacter silviterrae]|uniref:Putative acyltransferase n=1 Tax=Dinghuibacter silviterrae TaxID=1539049 RepID=A0A4R8DNC4_9BACT|nr:heparan-alpha-glucosaminide N-acetyltransferase domain-containing protein [Dinghuibacter silviterrae]TDW99205.1 putative acyltransferase [Dinghuibacter silviterrae]